MTKITRLSPIEVANNAALPFTRKRQNLISIEEPDVYWGYDPVRSAMPKLLGANGELFAHSEIELSEDDPQKTIDSVGASCKSGEKQKVACLAVAKSIVEWRIANNVAGIVLTPPPEPYRLSVDTIQFAAPCAVVLDGELYLLSFDPRSSLKLTLQGREVVKSMIWHTARIGNLRDAKVALLRTPSVEKGKRAAVFDVLEGEPLYSMDDLDEMITQTYAVWETILMERRAAASDGSAATGGLFG